MKANGQKYELSTTTKQLMVVLLFSILGLVSTFQVSRNVQDKQFKDRALTVAESVAAIPQVAELAAINDPKHLLQPLANSILKQTGATYIVITNNKGIRLTHPNPEQIGKRIDGPLLALDGKSYTTINKGSLGRSVNGKTPIFASNGKIVGLVSAGFLTSNFENEVRSLKNTFFFFGLGLIAIGLLVSQLFIRAGREKLVREALSETTNTLQEREAVLYAISEGVITLDRNNRIILINQEAKRLLDINQDPTNSNIDEILEPGRLVDLLKGTTAQGDDEVLLNSKYSLRVQRRPVKQHGLKIGSVVTIRDRTEHIGLLRELDSVKNLTDALRAQQHEYANRIHTVNGLIELGRIEEARKYLGAISLLDADMAEYLNNNLGNPTIVALIMAKYSIARERNVHLNVNAVSSLQDVEIENNALVTIIGNLLDNAIDAVSAQPSAQVNLEIRNEEGRKFIRVSDNGPGLPQDDPMIVFKDGYSTKGSHEGLHHGLGLAILQRLVLQSHGTIDSYNSNGAVFEVMLPRGSKQKSPSSLIRR